ncbi:DUF4352 domain-containing protein [Thermoanaerobacterium sp. RBIITD]|uniref:DUF4352 domain-containing protein n=1 Tax=Thermoanaerobacterium sp. RBIITD TaxID=1550240 RepID=UPI000BB9265C|nr:DUF4352 domain-containing protein [Thermoanaerobacterium sp. RBIITD]SNX53638.1 protein of unknown function [Thermoanaerobacterium sp. RBIITD]
MKKIILVLLAMLLLITIAGCTETIPEKQTTTPTNQSSETKTGNQTKQEAKKPEIFKIGDTVKMDKLNITVNGVRYSNGSDFLKPEDGKVYAIVDATIENIDSKAQTVSSMLMFKLADSDGYNYNSTIGDTKAQLDGEVGAGRKMRGEVAFEIPKDAKGLEFIFEPNAFGTGQAIFKLDK